MDTSASYHSIYIFIALKIAHPTLQYMKGLLYVATSFCTHPYTTTIYKNQYTVQHEWMTRFLRYNSTLHSSLYSQNR